MTDEKPPKKNLSSRTGINAESLTIALRLLALLPTRPGVSRDWLLAELEISSTQFYRVIRAIERSGVIIDSEFMPDGRKGFYLARQQQTLIDRLLRS